MVTCMSSNTSPGEDSMVTRTNLNLDAAPGEGRHGDVDQRAALVQNGQHVDALAFVARRIQSAVPSRVPLLCIESLKVHLCRALNNGVGSLSASYSYIIRARVVGQLWRFGLPILLNTWRIQPNLSKKNILSTCTVIRVCATTSYTLAWG